MQQIGVFYQCTNLTTGLMNYNQNLKEINNQLKVETRSLQESVTKFHQTFEETTFKIAKIQKQVFEIEQAFMENKSKQLVEKKQNQVQQYQIERDKTLNDLKNSLQQLG